MRLILNPSADTVPLKSRGLPRNHLKIDGLECNEPKALERTEAALSALRCVSMTICRYGIGEIIAQVVSSADRVSVRSRINLRASEVNSLFAAAISTRV